MKTQHVYEDAHKGQTDENTTAHPIATIYVPIVGAACAQRGLSWPPRGCPKTPPGQSTDPKMKIALRKTIRRDDDYMQDAALHTNYMKIEQSLPGYDDKQRLPACKPKIT